MAAPSERSRRKRPEYYAARTALARHMHRHHQGAYAVGTLAERLGQHDDLHWHSTERGVVLGHHHAVTDDNETLIQVAHRYLQEGQHG